MSISEKEKAKVFAVASAKMPVLRLRGNLQPCHNDDDDFLEVSVWELEAAFEAVYRLGLSDGNTAELLKSSIVSVLDCAGQPLSFNKIMMQLGGVVGRLELHEALALMVARKRLDSYVNDDGCIVYEIAGK